MDSGTRLLVALAILAVFLMMVDWSYISARVRAWWRRRQIKKVENFHQSLEREWNPRPTAVRTFQRVKR